MSRRPLLLLALSLALFPAAPARAGTLDGHRAELHIGPIVGGSDFRFDLKTSAPLTPMAIFFGLDSTPSVVPFWPVIGLDIGTAGVFVLATDAAGNAEFAVPSGVGDYGPAGIGVAMFFQAVFETPGGYRFVSNVAASEIEPLPAAPGFLADDAAARLPAGYDTLGAFAVQGVDLTRDGYPDLVLATPDDLRIWINDTAGGFTDETALRITWTGEALGDFAVGDMDGDRDMDIVTGGGYDDFVSVPDRLWLNDGTGHFTEAAFPATDGLTLRVELADVDGNGFLDVLLAKGPETQLPTPGGRCQLIWNFDDLAPHFYSPDVVFDAYGWNTGAVDTTAIRAGDVDHDGDLDLFVCRKDTGGIVGGPGEPNLLLENTGGGIFSDATLTHILPLSRSDNTQDAAFVDLDGDFDLDIVVANSVLGVMAADSNDVLINQGGLQGGTEGVFVDDAASFLEPNTAAEGVRLSVQPGDIDADGDVDLIITVHDLFFGADQMLWLNQGGAQGGTEGSFVRQLWFDAPFSGDTGGLGDFNCEDAELVDIDLDGDLDVVLPADGVVISPPTHEFTTRLLINSQL